MPEGTLFLKRQQDQWIKDCADNRELARCLKAGTWDSLAEATMLLQQLAQEKYFQYVPREKVSRRCAIDCPLATAVSLEGKYLHANFLNYPPLPRSFIASQFPYDKASSRELFWKLVFQQGSIVDLTRKTEGMIPYYPQKLGEVVSYGTMRIAYQAELSLSPEITLYTYQAIDTAQPNYVKSIERMQFSWADYSATSVGHLASLVQQLKVWPLQERTTVHCQAGVGRTGTLLTAYYLSEMIEHGWITETNLHRELVLLIIFLRIQRAYCFVETANQFELLINYGRLLLAQQDGQG